MKGVIEFWCNEAGGVKVCPRIDGAEKPPSKQQKLIADLIAVAADAARERFEKIKPPKETKKR